MPSSLSSPFSMTKDSNSSSISMVNSTTQVWTENKIFLFGMRWTKKPDRAFLVQPNDVLDSISDLSNDKFTICMDKLDWAVALYAK